ncbi:MAG: class I SAM-dependent methyltransferase [Cytophagales bacterium]|nr:class I SAM-dependent methyltransferase [Cytophagales bacterium]
MSCNCCGAERLFNLKAAKKELKKYRKSGAGKPTQALIDSLNASESKGQTLLDIGGGIGAIQWDFLQNGGKQTTDMDYSDGYLEVAKSYAKENGWSDQTVFRQGDFLEEEDSIENHDYVTLDKVICCYPDYHGLLTKALNKTNHTIGMVYPMGGSIAKFVAFFVILFLKLSGNSFRPYIHPVSSIRQTVLDEGFKSVHSSVSFPWHVEVYRRI